MPFGVRVIQKLSVDFRKAGRGLSEARKRETHTSRNSYLVDYRKTELIENF